MSVKKIWKIKENTVDDELIKACSGSRVLAVLLKNRGIDSEKKINDFLNPLKAEFITPDVFVYMVKAVNRIKSAVENREHITVYGDFDADGVTAAALLYMTLKKIGAEADYYLPDRANESHGLNTKALVKIISKQKSKLIITVDCGISDIQETAFAKGFKTDVIITDHHEAQECLPDAYAIINPKARGNIDSNLSIKDIESLNCLSGAGVVFKLACKLLQMYNCEEYVHELLPLAAIGTIGDVVELTGENRSIAAMGLELIRSGHYIGIKKLLLASGINDIASINAETIAFTVVPKINAAGRLDSPLSAFNLLVSQDDVVIDNSVKLLNDLNSLRQNLCDEVFKSAKKMYESNKADNKKSIILYNNGWHLGIIGIVASKLVEIYNKPVFLMTSDVNNPDIIRCSCRSIQGLNIHTLLSEHKELFEGFGGHKMAAGFAFDSNKISFDKFKTVLSSAIEQYSQDIDYTSVTVDADMILEPDEINIDTYKIIEKLEPFGTANPSPLFVINDLSLDNFRLMGQNNNHLKLFVSKNSHSFECVKWNTPEFNLPLNSKLDILFSLKLNKFNDCVNLQLMLSDIHSDNFIINSAVKVLDHRNKKNILMQVLDFVSATKKSTAIFLGNSVLKKKLNLPSYINDMIFSSDNIPCSKEQIMFFDCPNNIEEFHKIIKDTDAEIVHLMNFEITEISADELIAKLSGMIKYASAHLKGEFDIVRASGALGVDSDCVDCAVSVLENVNMVDCVRESELKFKILNFNPAELSKIKQDDLYLTLKEKINNINNFRKYYLNSSFEKIQSNINESIESRI